MRRVNILAIIAFAFLFGCTVNPTAQASFEESSFDFGKVEPGKTYNHDFSITNVSDVDLKIFKVGTSCGCTAAVLSDSIIPPRGKGKIRVTLKPNATMFGHIEKSVVMQMNLREQYSVLYVKGDVKGL